jgi:hypothetical protein
MLKPQKVLVFVNEEETKKEGRKHIVVYRCFSRVRSRFFPFSGDLFCG